MRLSANILQGMAAAAEATDGNRAAPSLHSTAGSAAAAQLESAASTMCSLPAVKAKTVGNFQQRQIHTHPRTAIRNFKVGHICWFIIYDSFPK